MYKTSQQDNTITAKAFGVNENEIIFYHSEYPRSRVGVKSIETAEKIAQDISVKELGEMYPRPFLGKILTFNTHFEVIC